MTYDALNLAVLRAVPEAAKRVLDLGCGSGALGEALKRRQNCRVIGVTASSEEAALANSVLDRVIIGDLESWEPDSITSFDTVICSHVLEHLRDPAGLLRRVRSVSDQETRLVVALPNTLHWRQRLMFLRGHFEYTDGGLMDRTHLRFFDWESSRRVITDGGWKLAQAIGDGHFPFAWRLPAIGQLLDRAATRLSPSLFGEQFVITAHLGA